MLNLYRSLRRARGLEVEGDGAAEAGFTLIELMVVLLIMGILLAIAIPAFLGVKGGAYSKAAQSDLTNLLTEAKASYADGQDFSTLVTADSSAGIAGIQASEPDMSARMVYQTGATSISSKKISVAAYCATASGCTSGVGTVAIAMAEMDEGGICWGVVDFETAETTVYSIGSATAITPGKTTAGTFYDKNPSNCNADNVVPDTGLATSFPA
jgi:type IV pilus assembly protein PilA